MRAWQRQKSSLQHRLLIGMGVMLLPLVLLGVGSYISFEGAIRFFEKTDNETLEELFPLANLEASIKRAALSANLCLSQQQPAECDRYQKLRQEVNHTFTAVLAIPSELPERQVLVESAQRAWLETQATFEANVDTNSMTAPPERQLEKLNASAQQAVDSLDQLYKLMDHLQLADNLAQAQTFRQKVRWIITAMFGLGLGVAGISGWLLARSILLPLRDLEAGVNHLGKGEFSYRIDLAAQDEFGHLAHTFNQMAQKIEQNQAELKTLATVDGLTGVYNRREFCTQLQAELERSQRHGHLCSLLILDIDHFKKLNDTYGHQAGDEALRCFATLIKERIRPADTLARYGGEEFVLILPETTDHDALILAERLRQAIATQPMLVSLSQTVNITSSMGLAVFPQDASSDLALIAAADQALYTAKRSGRNRVMSFRHLSTVF
jgi:two-component system, cell cycle response regulator